MPEQTYSFTLDEYNAFVDNVKTYPADMVYLCGILTSAADDGKCDKNAPSPVKRKFFETFYLPKEWTDLEKKIGGVLPYYLRGEALPDALKGDELALAYQTILTANQKAIDDILYNQKSKELINNATLPELKSDAIKEKLKKIEGIDIFDYLCINELVGKVCTYRHLPELMELADLLKKQGVTGDMEIVLNGAPGSLVPKINLEGSPDLKNMFKNIPMERYQIALSLYFMDWQPPEEAEDHEQYSQQSVRTIEDALFVSSRPTRFEMALAKAKDDLKVAIGW